MKRWTILACAALVGCTGSTPVYLVHKTGSNYADRTRAMDQCDFAAIKAVPRALATQVSGGYYNPGTVQCSTFGSYTSCNNVGAVNIPATATTYDANEGIRHRYVTRCLEDKGYSVLPSRECRTDAEKAGYMAALDNQPPASQIACTIPRR